MSVTKSVAFAAPYRSKTFNDNLNLLAGLSGVVSGGAVTTSGGVVTVMPLTFLQNGFFSTSDSPLTAGLPTGLVAPYYVAVTSSSNVQNPSEVITPTFVQRPEDISGNTVLVAEYDGQEWRPLPKIQLKEILFAINLRAVKQNFVGIASGGDVGISAGNVVVQPLSIIDRTGALIVKALPTTFTPTAADADGWGRVDEVFYRRPDDDSSRTGQLQYLTGQTYDPSGLDAMLVAHSTAFGDGSKVCQAAKTLIVPSTNEALFLYLRDYGARSQLILQTSPDGLGSIASAVVLASNVSAFDAVLNPGGSVDLFYTRGNQLFHATVDIAGGSIFTETLVATGSATLSNPRVVTVTSSATYFLHVVYEQATSGGVHDLYYTRLSASNTVETTPSLLVGLSALITNPSLDKDDEDSLFVLAYENSTTGKVYLREYDTGTATSLLPPSQIGLPLELEDDTFDEAVSALAPVGPANKPIVKRSANKTNFVFWRHFKGSGRYGIAVYSPRYIGTFGHKAFIPVLSSSLENIDDFDVDIDGLNYAQIAIRISGALQKATLRLDDLTVIGTTTQVVAADPTTLRVKLDAKGASIVTWAVASGGFSDNNSPLTAQFFGSGTFSGHAIAAGEVVFLQTDYNGLPVVPAVGDKVVIAGSGVGNNGTYDWVSVRTFTSGPTTYTVVMTSATFTTESSGPSAQFQYQSGVQTNFAKATSGVSSNLRGFYVTPTDIYIAHYRVLDAQLAVSGTALEEDQTITRLYDFLNTFGGASGQITWQKAGANKLVLNSSITLNVFNRKSTYTINANNPTGVTVAANQVAYVVLPDTDAPATLSLLITSFGAGILDRYGKNAFPLFWNIGGYLYMKFAPFRLESGGETVVLGGNLSEEAQQWIGFTGDAPDPSNHGYTHTAGSGLSQSDNLPQAISKLDTVVAGVPAVVQDLSAEIPIKLYATDPVPDSVLHLSPSIIQSSDGSDFSIGPIGGSLPVFGGAAINFQTGIVTGPGSVTVSFPLITVGYYIRAGVTLMGDGSVKFIYSADQAARNLLADAGTLFDSAGIPRGWIDLQCTASGKFKTAGSSTSIIEDAPGGVPAIYRIVAGVAPTSGSFPDPIAAINKILVSFVTGNAVSDSSGNLTLKS